MNHQNNSFVFITGATAGFGEACAKLYASKGFNLILTGRREERLNVLKQNLEREFKIEVLTLCFDVRDAIETKKSIDSINTNIQKKHNNRNQQCWFGCRKRPNRYGHSRRLE